MGLADAGTFLAGGGQLIGGLSKLFGDDDGPGINEQINNQRVSMEKLIPAQIGALVRGARNEGLHPLAVLGAGINSGFSPTYNTGGDNSIDWESIGQGVGRMVDAHSTKGERAFAETTRRLALEKASLENDLLRSQITTINRSNIPARPDGTEMIPGQGQSLSIFEGGRSRPHPSDPSRADLPPMTFWRTLMTPDGREVIVPSPEAANWMENDLFGTPRWYGDLLWSGMVQSGKDAWQYAKDRVSEYTRLYGR